MVAIGSKSPSSRTATAACTVHFSNATSARLIRENGNKKGDVLGVARIAGIMAAKRTSELVPLCHPIAITAVAVDVSVVDAVQQAEAAQDASGVPGLASPAFGGVAVSATVSCDGKTGVEMEALTAAGVAALTVYDMCKAVDRGMRIEGLRVVSKEGGKSGGWKEGVAV